MPRGLTQVRFDPEYDNTKFSEWGLIARSLGLQIFSLAFILFLLLFVFLGYRHFSTFLILTLYFYLPVFFIFYFHYRDVAVRLFIQRFAELNELHYERTGFLGTVSGKLFSIGDKRSIRNVVTSFFGDNPTRFFNYKYSRGFGRTIKVYRFTIWETKFRKVEFPHILLQSKKMPRFGKKAKNETKVSLKGNLDDSFRLYVARGYEIEVLQIFTPEVLQMLCDKSSEFSIEFAGNSMYIYDNTVVKNNKQLKELFDVARGIFDSAGPLINRLDDDFNVLHEQYGGRG